MLKLFLYERVGESRSGLNSYLNTHGKLPETCGYWIMAQSKEDIKRCLLYSVIIAANQRGMTAIWTLQNNQRASLYHIKNSSSHKILMFKAENFKKKKINLAVSVKVVQPFEKFGKWCLFMWRICSGGSFIQSYVSLQKV